MGTRNRGNLFLTFRGQEFIQVITSIYLANAVSLFRTIQIEQPGVYRKDVGEIIDKLEPINGSNVVMAAYVMQIEEWLFNCEGLIE